MFSWQIYLKLILDHFHVDCAKRIWLRVYKCTARTRAFSIIKKAWIERAELLGVFSRVAMTDTGKVVAIDTKDKWEKTLEECKANDKLIIAQFTTPTNESNPLINPAFTAMSKKYDKAAFVKIDVTKLADVMAHYEVTGVPYFLLIRGHKTIDIRGHKTIDIMPGLNDKILKDKILKALK